MTWWNIYFLIITIIGLYYIAKHILIIIKLFRTEYILIVERSKKHKRYKKAWLWKNKLTHGTPTEKFIKNIIFYFKGTCYYIFALIIIPFFAIFYLTILYFIFKWWFFYDHSKSYWIIPVQYLWWLWYFIRGTIVLFFIKIVWSEIKKFPKIVYFKDLRYMFARSFLMLYCLVLILTIEEIIQDIAFGTISTPLYIYYVNWFHIIFH